MLEELLSSSARATGTDGAGGDAGVEPPELDKEEAGWRGSGLVLRWLAADAGDEEEAEGTGRGHGAPLSLSLCDGATREEGIERWALPGDVRV